ncbi:MAG TPA: cohesin domain-containing protein [Candidatus Paceibacterota bacterium]
MVMFLKKYFLPTFIFITLYVNVPPAYAAEFGVVANPSTFGKGAAFEARVIIDTQGESINAFAGAVTFPSDLLTPLEVREGGSIVNFWIEEPRTATSSTVRFSGITPGGFNGKALLFSVIFRAAEPGSATIAVESPRALRNDGVGSPARVTSIGTRVTVSNTPASSGSIPPVEDTDPPEPFTPVVASDPAIFGGKYFLVFATQDKKSGIDHYEVCEGSIRQCGDAESPYLLHYQSLGRKIFVKAVDRAGNERIAALPAFMHLPWYQSLLLLAIIGILVHALFNWRRLVWQNYIQSP